MSYETAPSSSSSSSSSNMAIAAKSKPKVLLLGRVSADDKVVKELHDLAEVHNIPPLQTSDEARDAIHKAVKDHGPFEAVSVSPIEST